MQHDMWFQSYSPPAADLATHPSWQHSTWPDAWVEQGAQSPHATAASPRSGVAAVLSPNMRARPFAGSHAPMHAAQFPASPPGVRISLSDLVKEEFPMGALSAELPQNPASPSPQGASVPTSVGASVWEPWLTEVFPPALAESAGPPPGLESPPGLPLPPPGLDVVGERTIPPPLGLDVAPTSPGKRRKAPPELQLPSESPPFLTPEITPQASPVTPSMPCEALLTDLEHERVAVSGSRAEWQIVHLRPRLRATLGKPIVSPSFTVGDLSDLRLMLCPVLPGEGVTTPDGARGRQQRGKFLKMLNRGSVRTALKLKMSMENATTVRFCLSVGPTQRGPFTCDFKELAVHGCSDFCLDCMQPGDGESITVSLEILETVAGRKSAD